MKKLICAEDIQKAIKNGTKTIYVDKNTIITPSAKDVAKQADIEVVYSSQTIGAVNGDTADTDMFYKAIKALAANGNFSELLQALAQIVAAPFISLTDSAKDIKHILGNTIAHKALNANSKNVLISEFITRQDKNTMQTGFVIINGGHTTWSVNSDEVFHIVSGALTVEKNGEVFTAHEGDVLAFKKNVQLKLSCEKSVKIFYVKQSK